MKGTKMYGCLDPAHDFDFMRLRGLLVAPQGLAETVLLSAGFYRLLKPIGRRRFIAGGVLTFGFGSLVAAGHISLPENIAFPDIYIERDLRNVVIAQSLGDLSESDEFSGGDVLMIYPERHWIDSLFDAPSIQTYLTHDTRRNARFNFYREALSERFPTLFQSRHYPAQGLVSTVMD